MIYKSSPSTMQWILWCVLYKGACYLAVLKTFLCLFVTCGLSTGRIIERKLRYTIWYLWKKTKQNEKLTWDVKKKTKKTQTSTNTNEPFAEKPKVVKKKKKKSNQTLMSGDLDDSLLKKNNFTHSHWWKKKTITWPQFLSPPQVKWCTVGIPKLQSQARILKGRLSIFLD